MSYSNCDTTLVGGQRLSPEHHLSLRAAGGYNLLLLLFIVSSAHWLWLLLLCPKSSLIRTLAVIGRATAVLGRDEIPSWQRFLLLLLLLYIWPGDPAPENQHAHQSDSGPRRENTRSKRTSVPDISAPCAVLILANRGPLSSSSSPEFSFWKHCLCCGCPIYYVKQVNIPWKVQLIIFNSPHINNNNNQVIISVTASLYLLVAGWLTGLPHTIHLINGCLCWLPFVAFVIRPPGMLVNCCGEEAVARN